MKLNAISVLAWVCTRLIIYFKTQKGDLTLLSSPQNDLFNTEYLDKSSISFSSPFLPSFLLSSLPSLLSSFLFLLSSLLSSLPSSPSYLAFHSSSPHAVGDSLVTAPYHVVAVWEILMYIWIDYTCSLSFEVVNGKNLLSSTF